MEEQRFIAIETKLLHQEQLLEDLHELIYQQQKTIDLLNKKINKLDEQIQQDNQIRAAGEKPPHY
ncbi:MAG: SlyX family protein [Bdellovibrionaceae bacterium]|nr:SlyX family protein [Pseudobdellovibrionaceae bacterium]NUM60135.1 SlyX family protein [Pseudobdellovibrionaceae bacterium]